MESSPILDREEVLIGEESMDMKASSLGSEDYVSSYRIPLLLDFLTVIQKLIVFSFKLLDDSKTRV